MVYVGQTRERRLTAELQRLGVGECTVRGELPPRRRPWFHDNGAFRDFTAGHPFNMARWLRDQWRIRDRKLEPDFVVVPDIVGGGKASLMFSSEWRPVVAHGVPAYLVVQEGMSTENVGRVLDFAIDTDHPFAGLFVGGSAIEWKLESTPTWLGIARDRGLKLHVGRVGVPERVAWARALAVDSIDSSFPLFTADRLAEFLASCGILETT